MSDPETLEQWQEAVDAAAGARAVADCQMYGLIKGGPKIDVARCDEILSRGKAQGVLLSKPETELAIEFVKLVNAQAAQAAREKAQREGR
jgi:hypothetical protein